MGNFNTQGILQNTPAPNAGRAGDANAEVKAAGSEIEAIDALQMLLDVVGLIPGFGAPADIINGLISAGRGDWIGAGLSLFGVVPIAGEAATIAKIAAKSEKYLQALDVVTKKVLPHLPASVARKLEDAIAAARKKIEEIAGTKLKTAEPTQGPSVEGAPAQPGMRSKGTGRDCRLRKYKEGCSGGKTPHHVVPDRAFRMPGMAQPYSGGLAHSDGYTICVEGTTPIRRSPRANEHGLIHAIYDPLEAALGATGEPTATASLGELEALGVAAASKVTGCNPLRMAAELRAYHQSQGLSIETTVRADPTGIMSRLLDPKLLGPGATKGGLGGI